ncbi:hypothetical protein HK44_020325 [Pseudomonas fluorescens HK44]|uniref:Uncharacterized protein n=1 Tax=Pseudomonas fluorescens HK44 TaxID=1042209 RepID=A0A010RVJ8_PSEFL|nr:hypothetical protein [Pseudomonas fluorescens]EXF96266.1 hypothetical protein HK44_020325 [Pseudomonas fluorescens HK44]
MSEVKRFKICDDGIEWVKASDYDAALAREAALREELERQKRYVEINSNSVHGKHKEGQRFKEERDALREELASVRAIAGEAASNSKRARNEFKASRDNLQHRLTAAEQRNAACNTEIVAMVESALRRSFSLGQVYWQQADSDSTCQQNKSDQTMETQAQHILNVVKSINALTKPTESGASEDKCSACFGTGQAYSNGMPIGGTCYACKGSGYEESGASE